MSCYEERRNSGGEIGVNLHSVDWSEYKDALDGIDYLGLLSADFDIDLMFAHGLVAAEAEQAMVDTQQQPESAPNSDSMECHNGDSIGAHPNEPDVLQALPEWFACMQCGAQVPVVCPTGYCTPCCEIEMCGCDNQNNGYSSSDSNDDVEY